METKHAAYAMTNCVVPLMSIDFAPHTNTPTHTHTHTPHMHPHTHTTYAHIPLSIHNQIGSGHFGTVNKGTWVYPDGEEEEVAVKMVKAKTETENIKLLQEAAIMGQFAHPNVVRLLGVVTVGEPVS